MTWSPMRYLVRAERTRTEHDRTLPTPQNWTSAVDLGCWGFVMRQTCGYREQHESCPLFWGKLLSRFQNTGLRICSSLQVMV